MVESPFTTGCLEGTAPSWSQLCGHWEAVMLFSSTKSECSDSTMVGAEVMLLFTLFQIWKIYILAKAPCHFLSVSYSFLKWNVVASQTISDPNL